VAGRPLAGLALVVALSGLALLGGAGGAPRAVADARASLASPDRTGALLAARQVVADHLLTGTGPGHTQLRWEGSDGVAYFFAYAHNEYAQVAAELGLVGLVLLALLLAGWRGCCGGRAPPTPPPDPGPVWSRRPPPSPSTAASISSGTCRRSCSP
jgi:O-antigen ligase